MGFSVYRNAKHALPILLRKLQRKRLIVVVATAHKVGSTWLFHLLRDLGHFESKLLPDRFMHLGTLVLDDPEVFTLLSRSYGYTIYKSHSFPVAYDLPPSLVEAVRFVSIYRDPRDVLVSASFYVAHLPPEEGGWGDAYRALPTAHRIQTLIERGDFLLTRLEAWFHATNAHKVRYEDLLTQPADALSGVARYLNLAYSSQDLDRVIHRHSFKTRTGRDRGVERASAFLRKGIAGDWKNHFDIDCIDAFKQAKDGRWNQLLVDMNYETSLNW